MRLINQEIKKMFTIREYETLADMQRDIPNYVINENISMQVSRNNEEKLYLKQSSNIYFRLPNMKEMKEGVDFEWQEKEFGGMIIFSVVVNATIKNKDDFFSKIKAWFKKNAMTLDNILKKDSIINSIMSENPTVAGFNVGNFFRGRYVNPKNREEIFDEKSMSIEIIGITRESLIKVAEEIARAFNQETVLVKSYSDNKILLVNKF
jgi:hypothetical protein